MAAAAEENPFESVKKEDVPDVKACVKLAEEEFNKTNGGSWHVSSVQDYAKGAAGDSAAYTLKVVLCSGEQCQMQTAVVNPTTKAVKFEVKKKKASMF